MSAELATRHAATHPLYIITHRPSFRSRKVLVQEDRESSEAFALQCWMYGRCVRLMLLDVIALL